MTKNDYINKVNDIIKWSKIENDIDKISNGALALWECEPLQRVLSSYYELLGMMVGDIPDEYGTLLEYFMYECNYGKDWHKGMITDTDGKDVKLSTVEELANYIFKEKN